MRIPFLKPLALLLALALLAAACSGDPAPEDAEEIQDPPATSSTTTTPISPDEREASFVIPPAEPLDIDDTPLPIDENYRIGTLDNDVEVWEVYMRVDFDDEHVLIVRAVEDADASAFGQGLHVAPEEVVVEFFGRGFFKAEDLTALGVHAGHDVADGSVFAGGVHCLEDQQQRMRIRCI